MNADDRARRIESLRKEWTDQFVRANPDRPELRRFGDRVGRVVTVNWNGRALVDFQDGAWYDVPADPAHLVRIEPQEGRGKYDAKRNSAQPRPERGG
jgi:hypothetical protein